MGAIMASATQLEWLKAIAAAALASGHIWPAMAACEAACETGWGTSSLYRNDHNIFGTKQHKHPIYATVNLPTKEFLDDAWEVINAPFIEYPDDAASFADRMATLNGLESVYPHYAAALAATSGEDYVTQVSQTWSTSPTRAADAIAIYHAHSDVLPPLTRSGE